MSPSGASTAAAVTRIVRLRGTASSVAERIARSAFGRAPGATLLAGAGRERGLPVAQELEPLLRIEVAHDLRRYGNRLDVGAELLRERRGGVLGIDVASDREELDVAADELLAARRQDVVDPELGGVRVLRLLTDEHHA